ncbi:nuclear localized protein 1 [Oratosquilla oratoria]|uniref:nuclear localized protein 1 n=1 Tax=Oratosquilla oratoria TaxID=337810 RepID=UPI003F7774A9
MSLRALRKMQGGRGEMDFPSNGEEKDKDDEDEDEGDDVLNVVKPLNRFDLLIGGSPSESEVKEDDDVTEVYEVGDGEVRKDGLSPQPPMGVGAKKKRRKRKKKGRTKVPASSEDNMDPDLDEVESSLKQVNAMLGDATPRAEKGQAVVKLARNPLQVEHKHLNPQNEMKRIFGSRVVQANENNRRRGRGRAMKSTWIVQGHPHWAQNTPKPGISMKITESSASYQCFKYVHNATYQQAQFRFLDAVETLNPENIMALLNLEPYHIDTLLQVAEIFRIGDDSATAGELIERALYVLEMASHPLFNIATGTCRLPYKHQENRCMHVALFRHILNVGQKGCHRTALELCKLLLSLSPDDDPLAVSLMIDFYAIRAQEYAWLVGLYDTYEPTKNLSQLPNFAFSVGLALFHLSQGEGAAVGRERRDGTRNTPLVNEIGTPEELKVRADEMLQQALILFPGVLIPLLDKCGVQPDAKVSSHAFFGPSAQNGQNKGLVQLASLYVGRNYHLWKEPEVLSWLEANVNIVLERSDKEDPLVKEGEEKRKVRYQGTPTAIYRHIILAEVKDATAALPPSLSKSPVMSFDPLPPMDTVCDYVRPRSEGNQPSASSSGILTSFFRSIMPNYDPNAPEPEDLGEADGADGGDGGTGELRASVNSLLEAMRDLLSNIHLPEPADHDADHSDDEGQEWD